jgi:hypothetical protein
MNIEKPQTESPKNPTQNPHPRLNPLKTPLSNQTKTVQSESKDAHCCCCYLSDEEAQAWR